MIDAPSSLESWIEGNASGDSPGGAVPRAGCLGDVLGTILICGLKWQLLPLYVPS